MSRIKIIAVCGATGRQGGSVVEFLLKDGSFKVRGLTRNAESPKAKELTAKGVEVVQADFDDLESVKRAFSGAYGVFGVTDFWDAKGVGEEGEIRQGRKLVDAAKAAGVKHFVWSTLEYNTKPVAAHWKSKAIVDDYLKASGIPRTSFYTCMYLEAFTSFFRITKAEDGAYSANWPLLASDGPLWTFTVGDTGAWALEIFKKPGEWIDKDMKIMTNIFTPRDLVKIFEEESGKKVNYQETSFEEFDKVADAPGMHEMWANMRQFYDYPPSSRDMALSKRIYPQAKTLREFIKANLDSFVQ